MGEMVSARGALRASRDQLPGRPNAVATGVGFETVAGVRFTALGITP